MDLKISKTGGSKGVFMHQFGHPGKLHWQESLAAKDGISDQDKSVEGWPHIRPLKGRSKNKRAWKGMLAPLKFYRADQHGVAQWKISSSILKISRKNCYVHISSHGHTTESQKKLLTQFLIYFHSKKQCLRNSWQKGSHSTTLQFFCVQIFYTVTETTCITKKASMPQGRPAEPMAHTEIKCPEKTERKQAWWSIGDIQIRVSAPVQCPLHHKNSPNVLCPGGLTAGGPLPAGQWGQRGLLWRALTRRARFWNYFISGPVTLTLSKT